MLIRLASFMVRPDRVSRLRDVCNLQAIPRVRKQPGNLACLLLEPAGDGERMFKAMTSWDSRASGEAYDASGAAAEVVGLVRECFAAPPTLETFESDSSLGLEPHT
jgi:quinol monooxygenase YgiN